MSTSSFFFRNLLMNSCLAVSWKANSIFQSSFAEVQKKNSILNFFMASSPSAVVTCLSSSKSFWAPISTQIADQGEFYLASSNHSFMLWKESRSTMLYTMNTASLFLQKLRTIDLKVSCPAVSQICSFTGISSMMSRFVKNQSPMVGQCWGVHSSWMQRMRRQLLPTPEVPTIIILKVIQLVTSIYRFFYPMQVELTLL